MIEDQNGQAASGRFIDMDDVSDSDEQEMDFDSDIENGVASEAENADAGEEPPRKKQMQERTAQEQVVATSIPKWSNPDPYTVLPPPDESQKRKKDVVKLIRKARISIKLDEATKNAVAKNDDFISLDFGGDEAGKKKPSKVKDRRSSSQNGITETSSGSSSGPQPFSHRQVFHDAASGGAPTSSGSTVSAKAVGPTRPGYQNDSKSNEEPLEVWPPPSVDAALGSRKRTHEDEIKSLPSPPPPSRKGKLDALRELQSSVVPEWRPPRRANPVPWNIMDHSRTVNMGHW